MKKKVVEFETSEFNGYTLYFFYIQKKCAPGSDPYWIWDEDKLLLKEALIKYPKNRYDWHELDKQTV